MSGDDDDKIPKPRANPLLIGQDAAEAELLRAWRGGRMAHGWLLTGPRGIGKATLAFRFARYLLAGGEAASAGGLFGREPAADLALDANHPVFRRVAAGGHADLLTIERGWDEKKKRRRGEIVVEDVRELGHFLHLTPGEGGWRIVVIDSADEMNRNAANALLKLLEEPPARALLLLVSHAPGRLLPTIRSRCRQLSLPPLDEAVVADLLARYRPDLLSEDRALLVGLSEGSIGRALDLAEEGGVELYRELAELLGSLPRLNVAALHGLADRLARPDQEAAFRTATELVESWVGRCIKIAATGRMGPEIAPGEAAAQARLAAGAGLDRWLELWEKIARLFAGAERADLDRKQVFIGALLAAEGMLRR